MERGSCILQEQLGSAAALPGALCERAFNSACDTEKEPAASGNLGWFLLLVRQETTVN